MKHRIVKKGTLTANDLAWQRKRDEHGYWTASICCPSDIPGENITGTLSHLDYDGLQAMIADDREKFGDSLTVTDLEWTPPVEDFDAEQDRISRWLDDERFLTTSAFRNPAYGGVHG